VNEYEELLAKVLKRWQAARLDQLVVQPNPLTKYIDKANAEMRRRHPWRWRWQRLRRRLKQRRFWHRWGYP